MEQFRTEKSLVVKEYREDYKETLDQLTQEKNRGISYELNQNAL